MSVIDSAAWTGRPGVLRHSAHWGRLSKWVWVYRVPNDYKDFDRCKGVGVSLGHVADYDAWGLRITWGWKDIWLMRRTQRDIFERQICNQKANWFFRGLGKVLGFTYRGLN